MEPLLHPWNVDRVPRFRFACSQEHHYLVAEVSEHPMDYYSLFSQFPVRYNLEIICGYSMDIYWEHVPTLLSYAVHPAPGKGLCREFISVSMILGIPSRPRASYREEETNFITICAGRAMAVLLNLFPNRMTSRPKIQWPK